MKRSVGIAAVVLTMALLAGPVLARHHGGGMGEGMGKEMTPNPAMKKMHDAMVKMKQANKPLRDQIKNKMKDMRKLVKAEKFDKAAFIAKHREIKALKDRMMAAKVSAKADVLASMSVTERKAFVEMMGQKGRRHGMMKGKGMGQRGMIRGDMNDDSPAMMQDK